ncbi:hypothetical protein MHZ36_13900 [Staphylococcus sp. ACRSN]|uniref:hypothetical protein n=1 Tax=Staphylococcus sp. ACRSN TaxID=2918214 RepID=UPI001EF1A864|nr:hypothetical protein [Staphylococcus sp. ACRSN]MCG7340352.1 hypothetical protein [Staphylococcus sp. ACRSN]
MNLLREANRKANIFLGLDYLNIGMVGSNFAAIIVFTLLYIIHMAFLVSTVLLIINTYSITKFIGAVLVWVVVTYVYRITTNKLVLKK